MANFNSAEILDEAWNLTKRQYWHWLLVIVVAVAVPAAIIFIGVLAAVAVPVIGVLVILVGIVGFFYTFLGVLRNAYNASEGAKPSVSVLFRSDRFWWFLVAGVVYIGIVIAGFFALIIPGLIFAFMFALFPFALIANSGMTGFAALARSWELITTSFWRYIGFRVVLFGATAALFVVSFFIQSIFTGAASIDGEASFLVVLFSLAGLVLAVLINVFVSAFTYLADALAYRRLAGDGQVLRPN